jgi:hypothetical protein
MWLRRQELEDMPRGLRQVRVPQLPCYLRRLPLVIVLQVHDV